jgi:hypothetical protein
MVIDVELAGSVDDEPQLARGSGDAFELRLRRDVH